MSATLPTVLVADDDPSIRGLLELLLSEDGYGVLMAADGREALAMLVDSPDVSVILLDLVMPNQDGIETIRAIRQQCPGVKIVAMSGAFGGQFLHVAERLGAHASLDKPLNFDVLRRTLERILSQGS